jgi:hypothetical protein
MHEFAFLSLIWLHKQPVGLKRAHGLGNWDFMTDENRSDVLLTHFKRDQYHWDGML